MLYRCGDVCISAGIHFPCAGVEVREPLLELVLSSHCGIRESYSGFHCKHFYPMSLLNGPLFLFSFNSALQKD